MKIFKRLSSSSSSSSSPHGYHSFIALLTLMRRKSLFVRYAESTLHLFGLSIYLHSTCAYSMCIPLVASAATTKPHSTLFIRLARSRDFLVYLYIGTIHIFSIYVRHASSLEINIMQINSHFARHRTHVVRSILFCSSSSIVSLWKALFDNTTDNKSQREREREQREKQSTYINTEGNDYSQTYNWFIWSIHQINHNALAMTER